ncbi:hypothetical protein DQ04_04781000 [Trypanosoma grayi]|uniref:hypothetical protein n=1 Tax=Trypanosoma grayi TaxID=71804 RepID=UPI0004F472BF|nr:hypothetical protein DQ04_04781000 [Trypanosoma grayi]KEG09708.1 hypothetical protein DQ04_04781000 [Trypanosoma grayi]
MLGDRFINDVLRERHAWRRAMRQSDVQECLAPTSRAAKSNMGPVFRRGCTDNVCSLRFVNGLRNRDEEPGTRRRERALRQRLQECWNSSTVVSSSRPNLLLNLLLQQLESRGFSTRYEASRDDLLKTQAERVARRQKQRDAEKAAAIVQRAQVQREDVLLEESRKRRAVHDDERRKWKSIMTLMHDEDLVLLANTEFSARKRIFQENVAAYNTIEAEAQKSMQSITNLHPLLQKTYLTILQQERQKRRSLELKCTNQRDAIYTQLRHNIEYNILAEMRRATALENLLHQVSRLSPTVSHP